MPEVTLPPDLLGAISHHGGGRVVLVLGAGCSFEAPTSLPLSRECSLEAHRRLVHDGVLADGDCPDPDDLSCVADAVFGATGSQRDLVERLPREAFLKAQPNDGYLLAAAMLRERALICILTLNFDLAISSALTAVGAQEDVVVIAGPEDHDRLGITNVIYLHRNATAEADRWILRTMALEEEWRDHWEEVVAGRVVGGPMTVFVGLGTRAAVLISATRRIKDALGGSGVMYQAGPGPATESEFFAELGLPEAAYLQIGWGDFMRRLSERLVEEHRADLERVCNELLATEGWDMEDVLSLCSRLAQVGLIRLGYLRARWVLSERAYAPRDEHAAPWLADLLLAVGLIERTTGSQGVFAEDGVVEFRVGNRILGSLVFASGRGIRGWLTLETDIKHAERNWEHRNPRPRAAVIAGVQGGRPASVAPPKSLVRKEDPNDLVTGYTHFVMVSVQELRANPAVAEEILR